MTLFYDPKKRKVKPWVISTFIIISVSIMLGAWILIKIFADKIDPPQPDQEPEQDIFAQI